MTSLLATGTQITLGPGVSGCTEVTPWFAGGSSETPALSTFLCTCYSPRLLSSSLLWLFIARTKLSLDKVTVKWDVDAICVHV